VRSTRIKAPSIGFLIGLAGSVGFAGSLSLFAGCTERVVSAKGIGTDKYVVEPDKPGLFSSSSSKKAVPTGPSPNPFGKSRPAPSQTY
jgi:hypothetical protein